MILIILIAIYITISVATLNIYGKPLSKSKEHIILNNLNNYVLNSLNDEMLRCNTLPYISNVPVGIFVYYYVHGVGTVRRFSNLHRDIKQKFKELKSLA